MLVHIFIKMVYGKDNKLICLYFLNSSIFLTSTIFERGSPSLVGRGIANPMFERTRGFESHSPRPTRGVIFRILSKYVSIRIIK
jgi:hypothetical protein